MNYPETRKIIAEIAEVARKEKLEVYAVGGYVRDQLMGVGFSNEIDFAVVGNAPKFASQVASHLHLKSKVQVYQRFGTAQINYHEVRLEFAGTRKESYDEHSRNPEVRPASFEEDLTRRDFTINTLAINVESPDIIIDRFQGINDIKNKSIRTPGDPLITFRDDPLRILRAIRFASKYGFNIEENTYKSLCQERKRLEIVARERINDEFFKILSFDQPSRGINLLFESGVLAEIFPEISDLAGVEQIGRHHHKDVFYHTLKVLDKVAERSKDLDLRFAALVHDLGKPATKRFDQENGWTFHGHEHFGERMVKKFKNCYKISENTIDKSSQLVRLHMRPLALQDEGVTDSAIRRLVVQAGEKIDDLLILCRADITSGNQKRVNRYLASFDRMVDRMVEIERKDELRKFQSPIRGEEIMQRTGLKEGPRVGLIKVLIEEEILEGRIEYSYSAADQIFKSIVDKVNIIDDNKILIILRNIMRARNEGIKPV